MYNRYTPQPDGTYKRKSIPIPNHSQPLPIPDEHIQHNKEETTVPPPPEITKNKIPPKPKKPSIRPDTSAGSFLRDLLPKNLDTDDLLIIILLLLIAADGKDGQDNALFTLALYLFM